MKTVKERVQDLMNSPTPPSDIMQAMDIAQAAFDREVTAEHARQLNAQRLEIEKASGATRFLGILCSGLKGYDGKPGHPSTSPACTALENGVAVEPAQLATWKGALCYFPPKAWVFQAGHKPWSLTQLECSSLLAIPADALTTALVANGSPEAVKAYTDRKEALTIDGTLPTRTKN